MFADETVKEWLLQSLTAVLSKLLEAGDRVRISNIKYVFFFQVGFLCMLNVCLIVGPSRIPAGINRANRTCKKRGELGINGGGTQGTRGI